ncbi:MAG TPA: chemotaxis response regulator protein-glutamate methylesterase [Candidatus Polarisedimenticolaceae bacterium]|nr:chemotaxis response regulator protein-glutamate methylesterase [Candidatus Polarisedimenticolaceae bacterium]
MKSRRAIRVLVVDDSTFVRQALSRMLGSEPDIQVVGLAADGVEGVEKARTLRPDVITLDLRMPRMGGLEALERIMAENPVPVLLLSSVTRQGAEVTLRGLELGAMDFVDKSSVQGNMNLLGLAQELRAKVRALAGAQPRRPERRVSAPAPEGEGRAEAVVIATSTGGPAALQVIIPELPKDLRSAVLIVQHMPLGFTRSLAERLDARSPLPVREAVDGQVVEAGQVIIAPAGRHMKVKRRGQAVKILLDDEPRAALHRPSADVLMASTARAYGAQVLGVVLTGMGSDGVEGLRAIREAGGRTLAESEESCVIYGMPKAALEAGVVDRSVPLSRIADEILSAV